MSGIIPAVIIYAILVAVQIDRAHTPDELYMIVGAQDLLAGKPVFLFSPPLYLWLVALSVLLLGMSDMSVRLVGVVSVIAALGLIALLIKECYKDSVSRRAAIVLAGLFYVVHPMVVQGSMIVNIDNTILSPLILAFIYCLVRLRTDIRWFWPSVAVTTLFLWAKLSTSLVCMVVFSIGVWWVEPEIVRLKNTLKVFLSAIGCFCLSWGSIALVGGFNVAEFTGYAGYRVRLNLFEPLRNPQILLTNTVYLLVWFSPFIFAALLVVLEKELRLLRRGQGEPRHYLYLGALSLLSYFFIAPIGHGFPKYYVPLVGIAAIVLVEEAIGIWKRAAMRDILVVSGAGIIIAVYCYYMVQDPVYMVRYVTRKALAMPHIDIPALGQHLRGWTLLYCLALAPGYFLIRFMSKIKKGLVYTALLLTGVSASGALSLQQAQADYLTTYSYGERGTREVVAFLRQTLQPLDRALCASHISYYLQRNDLFTPSTVWEDRTLFLKAIKDAKVRCVVYSITSNSEKSFKNVFSDPAVAQVLQQNFVCRTIGEYSVWMRP